MTGRIIAVSGLCGAGKSTAIEILAKQTGGEIVYFGETVLRAVREQGLPETSANEQLIRVELRRQNGAAYLVKEEAPRIERLLMEGSVILVDAIYADEERGELRVLAPHAEILHIGIEATFRTRLQRLLLRPKRSLSEQDLQTRDAVELTRLRTGNVLDQVQALISNEGSIGDFENALRDVLQIAGWS